jgi:hypothetical protein
MMARPDFAYAQARLQARHARLPEAASWHALEASRSAGHYLAASRTGPLAHWTEGLDEDCNVQRIERQLRAMWRRYVGEVAHWCPARWQPATQWFGTLGELAVIDAACRRAGAQPWAQADEPLAALAQPDAARREPALRALRLTPFAALTDRSPAGDAAAIWLHQWQRLLPPALGDAALIQRPAEILLPRWLGNGGSRAANAEPAEGQLRKLFRRHAASAVAVFAHLALVALALERLRGGLVVRSLFDERAEPAGATASA